MGRIRTTRHPAERMIREKYTTAVRQVERDNKDGCDLMPQQTGLINPKLYTSLSDDEILLQGKQSKES